MNNQFKKDTAIENWFACAYVSPASKSRSTRALLVTIVLTAASVVACSPVDQGIQRDVGNMAYPAPLPQGNLATVGLTGRQPRDTGNMAYPEPLPEGNLAAVTRTGRQPRDTGNMAYPAPGAGGTVATTTVR